jgi:hypothetical protein
MSKIQNSTFRILDIVMEPCFFMPFKSAPLTIALPIPDPYPSH